MIKLGMFVNDRYEIIEKVGAGGMADVYKAKCHRLNRFVAIKILKQEYSSDTKFVAKFRAEAQSVAGLSHPNIVGVYDVGEDDGLYYIVMELVEGITLKKYIEKKSKLEVREAIGIAIQIAQGMEAAHDHHIIHRDIKPQNIIISKEGKIKVTDFGIAKAASSNTITSNAMGSVHYISPEQARGGYSDEKSDIYSLGITIYEMINGSVPFSGESTVAVALAHIQEEAVPLTVLDASLPKSIEKIVQKCIQKKPELRYLAAAALIADLKKAVSDPQGDFVKILPIMQDSSPTIHISDKEIDVIRHASKTVLVPDEKDSKFDAMDEDAEDDEDDSGIDPKLEKALVIGTVVVAVIICIVVIAAIARFSGIWEKSPSLLPEVTSTPGVSASPSSTATPSMETNDMPDLVNTKKETALAKLTTLGIEYTTTEEVSSTVEEGYVIRTNPEEGEEVSAESSVTVYVSSGPEEILVPDVEGMTITEAETKLLALKLKVKRALEFSTEVAIEKVISTDPEIGTGVKEGDTIKVTISKGKEPVYVKVPSLLGKTKDEAVQTLKELGLKKGTITNNNSETYVKGQVCAQSQAADSEVEKDTTIDFTISLGPEVTYAYFGKITISDNPFASATDPAAEIKLVLDQDGIKKEVFKQVLNYSSFPLSVASIPGASLSPGEIKMYKSDALVGSTYYISFEQVAQ